MTSLRLEGRRALVTGGSRGIGAAIARRLASEGAAVAINYRSGTAAAVALIDELSASGRAAYAFKADVSDRGQIQTLVAEAILALGGLDILVSNAGVEHFGALEEITPEDFDRVFHLNVAGQLFAAQAAAAAMTSGGRILLTSSISARFAAYHHTLYAASKAAVSAMVLNLAPELAERGIAINAIAPGGTNTDMARENAQSYTHPALVGVPTEALIKSRIAVGRLAEPDEIAAVSAFLVSPDASYITGSTLDAAGGM
jgi:3-oxoacyl-[acyl-carrier protein] reductase